MCPASSLDSSISTAPSTRPGHLRLSRGSVQGQIPLHDWFSWNGGHFLSTLRARGLPVQFLDLRCLLGRLRQSSLASRAFGAILDRSWLAVDERGRRPDRLWCGLGVDDPKFLQDAISDGSRGGVGLVYFRGSQRW